MKSGIKGRVIQSTGKWYIVQKDDGTTTQCSLAGKFRLNEYERTNPIAVGDWVEFEQQEDGSGRIHIIQDRMNAISREATHGKKGTQIIAANIDLGIVVQSLVQPEFKPGFTDRFLVTCEAYEIQPLIIINKVDLAGKAALEYLNDLVDLYSNIGYELLPCSIYDENLLNVIKERIRGKTCVFVGPSGVGKSSILNTIAPEAQQTVNEISRWSNKGTHTTTFARLIPLKDGGSIVDTPGIREFGLVDLKAEEVDLCFPEFEPYRDLCRYHNCLHIEEPDCSITKAYDDGKLSPSRYRSYLNIVDSLKQSHSSKGRG
jgi:ribosome biogenesis GTPase / thiamine phosphate phosphatase